MLPRDTLIAPDFVRGEAIQALPGQRLPDDPPDLLADFPLRCGRLEPAPAPQRDADRAHDAHRAAERFTWHPHRGLEIYTWVLEGRIHHEDTTGGMGDIHAGELQRMFSGITSSTRS